MLVKSEFILTVIGILQEGTFMKKILKLAYFVQKIVFFVKMLHLAQNAMKRATISFLQAFANAKKKVVLL